MTIITTPTLTELSRRATIDRVGMSKYNIKALISTVAKLYEQGDFDYRIDRLDNAFVNYMKGCSIMIEVIAKHPNYKEAKKDPNYKQLKARINDGILERLEEIRSKLQQNEEKAQVDDVNEIMDKYPPLESLDSTPSMDSILDSLPSVPKHDPSHSRESSNNAPVYMKMPEPELPTINTASATTNSLQIPSPTNFVFPSSMIVEPSQLASWIVKKKDKQQPNVLLIDIRPREVFDQGFIKHSWITQIEPLILKQNISSDKIEERMFTNPDVEQQMFTSRDKFDLVVYYDQNSQSLNSLPLNYLRESIYEMEFKKVLRRAPMMLVGGFDAWKSAIGEKGIFRYKDNQQQQQYQHHWLKDAVQDGNLEPVKVHHTFYDYFNSGTSNVKQSMVTERPALRGPFSNTIYKSTSDPYKMPIPQPAAAVATIATTASTTPTNTSTLLTRKKTFIDNPYYGFTSTTNKEFQVPPKLPQSTDSQAVPASSSPPPPPLPPKTFIQAPISSNSFSQMGNVMIGTTGLKNLGNTCYMNSIIQCLSGTIPFARYFLSGAFRQHINKENFLGTGGVVVESFSEIIRTMWSGNYNFISPILFRQAIVEFAPQFRGSEQHDSQEFLTFILDGIHEDCNLITKKPVSREDTPEEEAMFEKLPDWKASGIAWERYLERNSSVVVSLFQGQYRSRLTCLTCHATSTTYNTFMSLSLPIPATRSGPASVSIYDCLDYFVKEEILEQDNAWRCPSCKTLRRASKTLALSKLPDVLLIHLKRFSFDGPFKDKLETVVDSPLIGLDLSRYVPSTMYAPDQVPQGSQYDLYAVSNHFGTLTGGHYTACVRNGYKNEWHQFDDTRFSVCDNTKVLSRAAYNLFYVRSTVK